MSHPSPRRPLAARSPTERDRASIRTEPGTQSSIEIADIGRYVGEISGELSTMTKSARLTMLTYLLAMVRQEADRIARGGSKDK